MFPARLTDQSSNHSLLLLFFRPTEKEGLRKDLLFEKCFSYLLFWPGRSGITSSSRFYICPEVTSWNNNSGRSHSSPCGFEHNTRYWILNFQEMCWRIYTHQHPLSEHLPCWTWWRSEFDNRKSAHPSSSWTD